MNNKNSNRNKVLLEILFCGELVLNAYATGQTIGNTFKIINNGYDRNTMMILLLWLLMAVYTGHKAYKIHQYKKNINNNNKQR